MALSVVLQENVDENYEPTQREVVEYARWIGMEPEVDVDLMWIAREGLKSQLPAEWKACRSPAGELYYFNFATGESSWDHPNDERYRQLYAASKRTRAWTRMAERLTVAAAHNHRHAMSTALANTVTTGDESEGTEQQPQQQEGKEEEEVSARLLSSTESTRAEQEVVVAAVDAAGASPQRRAQAPPVLMSQQGAPPAGRGALHSGGGSGSSGSSGSRRRRRREQQLRQRLCRQLMLSHRLQTELHAARSAEARALERAVEAEAEAEQGRAATLALAALRARVHQLSGSPGGGEGEGGREEEGEGVGHTSSGVACEVAAAAAAAAVAGQDDADGAGRGGGGLTGHGGGLTGHGGGLTGHGGGLTGAGAGPMLMLCEQLAAMTAHAGELGEQLDRAWEAEASQREVAEPPPAAAGGGAQPPAAAAAEQLRGSRQQLRRQRLLSHRLEWTAQLRERQAREECEASAAAAAATQLRQQMAERERSAAAKAAKAADERLIAEVRRRQEAEEVCGLAEQRARGDREALVAASEELEALAEFAAAQAINSAAAATRERDEEEAAQASTEVEALRARCESLADQLAAAQSVLSGFAHTLGLDTGSSKAEEGEKGRCAAWGRSWDLGDVVAAVMRVKKERDAAERERLVTQRQLAASLRAQAYSERLIAQLRAS